jgi:hypothetical protein
LESTAAAELNEDADLEFLIREWDEDKTETITQQAKAAAIERGDVIHFEMVGHPVMFLGL